MKIPGVHIRKLSLWLTLMVPLLAFAIACGAAEEPAAPAPAAPQAPAAAVADTAPPTPTPTPVAGQVPVAAPTATFVPTPTPSTGGLTPKRGGTLEVVNSSFTQTWDMYLECCPNQFEMIGPMYNNLFVNYEGDLSECEICSPAGWHLEDEGKTMVFTLERGIKFHDGKELTSSDVKYSLDMIMGNIDGLVSPRCGVMKEYIDSIETPSAYKLVLKLVRPSAFLPKILSVGCGVINPDGVPRDELRDTPHGSGPYVLKEWIPNVSGEFEANPNYFKAGLPYMGGITWVRVADRASRAAAFYTGKGYKWVGYSPSEFPRLFKMVDEGKAVFFKELCGDGPHGAWMTPKPPFDELKVRQAVNLGLDRQSLGTAMYGDLYTPQLLHYCSGQPWGTDESEIWNVEPGWGTGAKKQQERDQAMALMKEAGLGDGIDIKQFVTNPNPSGVGYTGGILALQDELSKIGIRTELDYATSSQDFVARTSNHDFLVMWYIYYMTTYDPDEIIGQYWITGGARNNHAYSNPEVDKKFIDMSAELDAEKRKGILFEIQDIILKQDQGYAPGPTIDRYAFIPSRLKNFKQPRNVYFSSGFMRKDKIWIEQ